MGTAQIREFVDRWFSLLSAHAPVGELTACLAATGLEMIFPERTLRSIDDFTSWYAAVGEAFADQDHDVERIEIQHRPDENLYRLGVSVVWRATNVADGKLIAQRATQAWVLQYDKASGEPRIQKYYVVKLIDLETGTS
ncbi:hypothetical protein BKG77_01615 [Mycobacteroides chelonae]|uniref:SnoaL-like domain-containing protein n=1 Tax=Mycobacteroides chelonae TaxID=1774 RepID=A0A1S1M1K2_MYCCH|nr:hypothetical protein [Mycobacteroides chelonae]OHU28265.1 hypothetical protein BKG77_01615 [Mycobacteroides chelonae]OHU63688.1 hypothetical protein BKG85_09300 [Mycobacteroides chelonae]OHU76423.1 hypothetical protein BKG84_24305 [Mycobacteroides chelonae]QQG88320.1 hypothetical protein HBA99_14715 [Mycobacteroides chelonae]QQG93137.1 hypothetical protein HBA97_14715 [Mycobacteroides chelonae]